MTVTVTVTGTLLSGGALVEVVVVQRHYLALLDEQLVLVATRQLAPAPGIGSGHGGVQLGQGLGRGHGRGRAGFLRWRLLRAGLWLWLSLRLSLVLLRHAAWATRR